MHPSDPGYERWLNLHYTQPIVFHFFYEGEYLGGLPAFTIQKKKDGGVFLCQSCGYAHTLIRVQNADGYVGFSFAAYALCETCLGRKPSILSVENWHIGHKELYRTTAEHYPEKLIHHELEAFHPATERLNKAND